MTKFLLACLLTALSFSASAKSVKIQIVIDDNNCPIAVQPDQGCGSGEDVCFTKGQAHNISWKYKGSATSAPDFQIVMKNSSDHGIFEGGCHQSSKSVHCKISPSAYSGSYAYSVVNAAGCEYDPKIIIND